MALNLSTLTNPATSGTVLAEALTTADFLDPVPILKNLSRGSNKGGDAKQTTALNQPKALPLIDNEGYCFFPSVSGNYASTPDSSDLDITGDITLECDFIVPEFPLSANRTLLAKYNINTNARSYTMFLDSSGNIGITLSQDGTFNQNFLKSKNFSLVLSSKTRATVKVTWRQSDGRTQFFVKESDGSFTQVSDNVTIAATSIYNSNAEFEIGSRSSGQSNFGSSLGVFGARIYASVDGTDKRLDVDFTATNVRHGDTKFKCATGQVVTVNQDSSSSNDVATIIKRPVLRFDGVNDGFKGLFNQTIDGGYMFAAFSVLGDGGEAWGRIISVNKTGGSNDYTGGGMVFSYRSGSTNNLGTYKGFLSEHVGLFDSSNKDILSEAKATQSATLSRVNNADEKTTGNSYTIEGDEFNIGQGATGLENPAIDLEYLALFPADSVPDEATATKIRDYINKRNNVFSLVDNSYYFFDPQKATFTGNFTGSNTLDGYITGSDLGDTDVRSNLTLEQSTLNDQPSTDGYTITFNDAAEHLEFENAASQTLAGWQVVGTSLGTFAYRVNANAVTELNLLGNLGQTDYRKAGDLYGIILLPESATGADIEAARSLLIDRGAADGTTSGTIFTFWYNRDDIVEFKHINTSSVTLSNYAWYSCQALEKFPALDLSNSSTLYNAWFGCTALSDFGAIQADSCGDFTSAWQNCSSLTSFPADAKLGTSAQNVNFESAWQSSGLTSLPALDLSKGVNFLSAFLSSDISSIDPNVLLGTAATSAIVDFANIFNDCQNLTEVPVGLDLSKGDRFQQSFRNCASLVDFAPNIFDSIGTPLDYCFNSTWQGTVSLNAVSVENILVSIDSNGQSAPSTGPQITIDYNTATGSLSAATNTAVTSLKAKGWSIIVNGVTL